jgi:hypothetical protein
MTTLFNYDPYFDDFNEDDNFMRVLFRPGYAVQARELTQLQTILSNQIEKFGNHIFKSGSPIVGGKISLDDRCNYLILQSQYNGIDINPELFIDKLVISYNTAKSVRAKVIAIDTSDSNAPVLVLKYLSGEYFSENDEIKIFGQNIFAQVRTNNAVGKSYVASIQDGVYYFKGQFVKVVPQFLVLELFYRTGYNALINNVNPSYKIGIEFEDTIIDEIDDTGLLDPAQGSFNFQAPGATRYKVSTTLSKRTLDSADDSSFIEVIRLVNGIKTKELEYPIYNEIEKTLARRTYDESGNYTVDPFVISLEEGDAANGTFIASLDPGKAYVGGYEFQTIAPTQIIINRGRDTATAEEYDIPTNYSSYVVLDNIFGTLDISSYPLLDVHCVPYSQVNVSTTATYTSTKIGSLRANMMKYNDATSSDLGDTHSFYVHVFDPVASSITGTTPAGSSNTVINLPTTFSSSASANAYAGMYFRITDASGSGISPVLISQSNSVSRTITLSSALPFAPTSNTFSIDSDFKVAESIVYKDGSITFAGNVNSDSKDPVTGYAYITEPSRNSLVFDFPYVAMKNGTIENLDFYARKLYGSKVSGGGGIITITAEGTDTFAFSGSPGTISDSVILNNIICFIRSDSASNATFGITPNTVLSLANNNFTVTAVSPTTFTIDVRADGVIADLLITSKVNNAENSSTGAIRGKQFIPINAGVDLHTKVPYELDPAGTTLDAANSSVKTAVSGTGWVFNDIGSTFFDNTDTLKNLRTPGVAVSLQVPDVYEIVRIIDSKSLSQNVTTSMLTSSSNDVTVNYEFDNGQKKTHYDHATIKLKRGYSSPTGKIYVQYRYLKHQSAPSPQNDGLFTVDSYLKAGSNFTYDQISKFNNKEDNKLTSLRSAYDFRPTRSIGGSTLSGAVNPDPDFTAVSSFDYYLSRIDQIVVKPSKEFAVISGKSAISPKASPIGTDDMKIYTLYVPAYTESIKDVRVEFKENRRYTMRDLNKFDNRIKGLEYYVALNSLEKSASATKILDSNGLERSKYGILVDNFTTNDVQATYSEVGFDNRCLVENSSLLPASLMRTIKMEINPLKLGGPYKIVGSGDKKVLMLDYTKSELASQRFVTKSVPVAGALFANFLGNLKLFPEFSAEVDTNVNAKVVMNSTQGLDSAFSFINDAFKNISDKNPQWTLDKNSPFARTVDSKWYTTNTVNTETREQIADLSNKAGTGGVWNTIRTTGDEVILSQGAELFQDQITTSSSETDLGNYVTDLAIQPYLKPQQIIFSSEKLRPNSVFFAFFDGTPVYQYTVVPNKITLDDASGFKVGEKVLVANTTSDLTANLSSYNSGGSNFSIATISATEVAAGSNNVYIINETGKPLTGKVLFGLDSVKVATVNEVITHQSGVTQNLTSNTITLQSDGPSTNISGNAIYLIHETGSATGLNVGWVITSYNVSTKVATVNGNLSEFIGSSYTYSFGSNRSNLLGQVSGAFYTPLATFRSGERTLRITDSFNNTFDEESTSYCEQTFVSSGVKVNKTNLVDTVYNVGVENKFVGIQTSNQIVSSSVESSSQLSVVTPPPEQVIITNTVVETRVVQEVVIQEVRVVETQIVEVTRDPPPSSQPETAQDFSSGDGGGSDPLAQTFYVDPQVYPNGIFLSDIDLYFRNKDDDNIPVSVEIRPTVNATPHSDFWYPETKVTKYPSEIVVAENPSLSDPSTKTNFEFFSPVFLRPGMYAFVVKTDSPEYTLWVAEKGKTTLRNEFVSINPYIGTMYKSQNSMEYVPYINEDITFRLNRCRFADGSALFTVENQAVDRKYYFDKFRVLETSIEPLSNAPIKTYHSFASKPVNQSVETSLRSLSPSVIYSMGEDDRYVVGNRRKELQNKGDFAVQIQMNSFDKAITPIISLESFYLNIWENFIDNSELEVDDFNIISSGTGYANTDTITVNSTTGSGANVNLIVNANGSILGVNVASSGESYIDDFDITINTSTGTGGEIVLNSEFDSTGGPCDARYITKPITLADGFDAGDLRVYLAANKPITTEVHVFFKAVSSDDPTPLKDRPYFKLECINPTATPSKTTNDYREYEYRPSLVLNDWSYVGENGVTYDNFKSFSVKIVMTSGDPSVIPKVKDLRIIALPAE